MIRVAGSRAFGGVIPTPNMDRIAKMGHAHQFRSTPSVTLAGGVLRAVTITPSASGVIASGPPAPGL
jgi:hypothetical protein